MSVFGVERLLFDLGQRPELRGRFVADVANLLDEYPLTNEERDAVRRIDLKWLYERGVNPMLLLRFNLTGQIPTRQAYTRLLTEGAPSA